MVVWVRVCGGALSIMQTHEGADMGTWLVSWHSKICCNCIGWGCLKPTWMRFTVVTSRIRCFCLRGEGG